MAKTKTTAKKQVRPVEYYATNIKNILTELSEAIDEVYRDQENGNFDLSVRIADVELTNIDYSNHYVFVQDIFEIDYDNDSK